MDSAVGQKQNFWLSDKLGAAMQDALRLMPNLIGRVAAIIFTLFLAVMSGYYKWRISQVIGIGLLGTNFLDANSHKRVFRVGRPLVIAVGAVIWLIAALIELKK